MYQMCLCKSFQIYQCGEKKAEHQSGEINERNPLGENSLIKPSGTEEVKDSRLSNSECSYTSFHSLTKDDKQKKKKEKKSLPLPINFGLKQKH